MQGEVTDTGLVYALADGALDQLAPGVAVALSVQGTGIAADVLWPELTPLRIVTRRTGIRAAGPRRVVAQGGSTAASPPVRPEPLQAPKPKQPEGPLRRPEPDTDFADPPAEPGPPPPKRPGPTIDVSAPPTLPDVVPTTTEDVARAGGSVPVEDAPANADDKASIPIHDEPRRPASGPAAGWRMPAVAAVAVAAFCAGAAASGAAFLMRPAHVETTALPSPYDLLHALPEQSPDGTPVDMADAGDFLLRGRSAKTAEDGSFWRRWAMRSMLETNAGGSAATLSDFAVELARTHTDPPTLAAARFLWELATLGQDCTAMQNIATALGVGGDKAKAAEIAAWQDREQQCRSRPSSAPN